MKLRSGTTRGWNNGRKLRIALLAGLLAIGVFSVASFAATSGTGSISVSSGGTGGQLGEVTGVGSMPVYRFSSALTGTNTVVPLSSTTGLEVGDTVWVAGTTGTAREAVQRFITNVSNNTSITLDTAMTNTLTSGVVLEVMKQGRGKNATVVSSSASTTVSTVASAASFSAGEYVTVVPNAASPAPYTGVISSISGSTITLSSAPVTSGGTALGTALADGSLVLEAVTPNWPAIMNSASTVVAGDVYLVDVEDYTGNVAVTLYVTNPDELAIDYSYLNTQVNVHVLCDATSGTCSGNPFSASTNAGAWGQATTASGGSIGTQYLTLSNGFLVFILAGGYEYAISVDGGTGYTIATTTTCTPGAGCLAPDYFLDMGPA